MGYSAGSFSDTGEQLIMSLTLTIGPSFEFAMSRSSLYLEAFGFELAITPASVSAPGSSWWEVSRYELGTGWRVVLGPLCVELGRS